MDRREFIKATLAGLAAASAGSRAAASGGSVRPAMVMLGFDGVDPRLVERWAPRLPHLSRLARQGGLHPLGSTSPPNSPVAWTTFATGKPPTEHGVFGFLRRDPRTYLPGTAPYTIKGPAFRASGIRKPSARSHRHGRAFWELVDDARIAQTLLFVPYAYPPPRLAHGRVVAGLGTPDLRFTNSSFTLFTSDTADGDGQDQVAGGRIVRLAPAGKVIETHLDGPRGPERSYLQVPVRIELDRKQGQVEVSLGGRKERLREGQRSGWFPVRFEAEGLALAGRVRLRLLSVRRVLRIYASPIQFDPARPALPLGGPASWLPGALEIHGGLPTVGWVHDTSAVNAGALPDKLFLEDLLDTMEGRADLLLRELRSGFARLLVGVFTGTDRAAHMFYRDTRRKDGGRLRVVYQAMDRIVGRVQQALPAGTRLLVMSDHGFHPFDRQVHLNTWLESQGLFFRRQPGRTIQFLRNVDWARTEAYALGNGQLYVNCRGREAHGSVAAGAGRKKVIASIRARLLALKDPVNGQAPVRAVYDVADRAAPEVRNRAPDLQAAFAPGYRSSWETSLGGAPTGSHLAPNPKAWCGDHAASDVQETPGFICANTRLAYDDPNLLDLAPTLLAHCGLEPTGPGRPLFT